MRFISGEQIYYLHGEHAAECYVMTKYADFPRPEDKSTVVPHSGVKNNAPLFKEFKTTQCVKIILSPSIPGDASLQTSKCLMAISYSNQWPH